MKGKRGKTNAKRKKEDKTVTAGVGGEGVVLV